MCVCVCVCVCVFKQFFLFYRKQGERIVGYLLLHVNEQATNFRVDICLKSKITEMKTVGDLGLPSKFIISSDT